MDTSSLPDGWQIAYDESVPSCRSLAAPYTQNTGIWQYYVIDGFLLSPNVQLESIHTIPCEFVDSDHNPVKMDVVLK
jgi:hypothetical protein